MEPLDRLEGKLDKVADSVASIDKTLAGQAVQIAEHIRRTNLLEEEMRALKGFTGRLKGGLGVIAFLLGIFETVRHFIGG